MRRLFCIFYLITLIPAITYAQDLRSIGQLARDGAPGLALELLGEVQPDATKNIQGWLFFERQRVAILRDWGLWQPLVERLSQFPKHAEAEIQRWAKVEMANALLEAKQGEQARTVLRKLIWHSPEPLSKDEFSLFRRLVIRSYLIDDRLSDARQAMLRYTQDYGDKGKDWIKLQARVFLRTNHPADAEQLFSTPTKLDTESLAIKSLAQLRAMKKTPAEVIGEVRQLIKTENITAANRARLWKVVAEAATALGSHITITRALEQAALLSQSVQSDVVFAINGDNLWKAYRDYAMFEGNGLQLLIGQDEKWLQNAESWWEKRPERSRAFFSIVMFEGAETKNRENATKRFIESAMTLDEGVLLLRKLFLNAKQFSEAESIPNTIRYFLVDDALSRNAIETATHLMSGLQQAPEGSDEFEWGLRRARILILGGKADEGIAELDKIISEMTEASKEKTDRATQVVFDLQAVGQHQQAIELFDKIFKLAVDQNLRRELLYWKADSFKALDNKVYAAMLYLQSATLLDGKGFDPWGQTARFQAAEILADAGLVGDAQRLYESLMKVTREPGQRAAIRYKLQELWLKKK